MKFVTVHDCAIRFWGSPIRRAFSFSDIVIMRQAQAGAPLRAFAVHPAFDQREDDTALFVNLVRAGHVFCAGEAGQGWAAPPLRRLRP